MVDFINDYAVTRNKREYIDFFPDRRPINDPLIAGYNYVFFTSPDLSLTSSNFNGAASANVSTLLQKNGTFLKLPSYGDSIYTNEHVAMLAGNQGTFMKMLSNRARSFPGSTETLATLDYSETWNRYKIAIGSTTKDSKIAGNFEIAFAEDDNLTVTKAIKLWVNYIEGLFMGDVISAMATQADIGSAQSAYIDYMSSMYHFATKPDGRTLVYWAKYTGLFPTKLPWEVFQSEDGSPKLVPEVNIDFEFAYKEDMNIAILRDFNLLSQEDKSVLTNVTGPYYAENGVVIPNTKNSPSIFKQTDTAGNNSYKLFFADYNDPSQPNNYLSN